MAPAFAAADRMAARCGGAPVLRAFAGSPRVLMASRSQLRSQRARQVTRMAVSVMTGSGAVYAETGGPASETWGAAG